MFISGYWGVLVLMVLGLLTGVGALAASHLLGAKRSYPNKNSAYECGIPTEGASTERFSVLFYLVAVSFILFDIEAVFLVPWALSFRSFLDANHGYYILSTGLFFVFVVTLGLIYEWRKGLLDWNR